MTYAPSPELQALDLGTSPRRALERVPTWRAAAASPVGQDDRSRRRFNAARFRASLVQLRPALRRALRRGV